jgi:hypothetical protein
LGSIIIIVPRKRKLNQKIKFFFYIWFIFVFPKLWNFPSLFCVYATTMGTAAAKMVRKHIHIKHSTLNTTIRLHSSICSVSISSLISTFITLSSLYFSFLFCWVPSFFFIKFYLFHLYFWAKQWIIIIMKKKEVVHWTFQRFELIHMFVIFQGHKYKHKKKNVEENLDKKKIEAEC